MIIGCSDNAPKEDIKSKQNDEAKTKAAVTPAQKEEKVLSKNEETAIKTSASRVLYNIAQARGFLASKNAKEAQRELQRSRAALERITDTLPTAILRSQIYAVQKRLSYDSSEEIRSDMFPIYSALDEISDVVYVEDTKKYLKEAEKALVDDNKEEAHKSFSKATQTLIYTEIDAPVSWSIEHLAAAEKQTTKKAYAKADAELKAAAEGVQILAIGAYDPLARAKGNYWRALKFYTENRMDEASKELLKAKDNLQKITKPNKKATVIIQKLNSQIDELSKKASGNTEVVK
jgi:hypothetical protein